jgi:hypothetical protein
MFNPPADARVPCRGVILLWRGNHCRITVRGYIGLAGEGRQAAARRDQILRS